MFRSLISAAVLAAAGATAALPTHPVTAGLLLAVGTGAAAGAAKVAEAARRPALVPVDLRRGR